MPVTTYGFRQGMNPALASALMAEQMNQEAMADPSSLRGRMTRLSAMPQHPMQEATSQPNYAVPRDRLMEVLVGYNRGTDGGMSGNLAPMPPSAIKYYLRKQEARDRLESSGKGYDPANNHNDRFGLTAVPQSAEDREEMAKRQAGYEAAITQARLSRQADQKSRYAALANRAQQENAIATMQQSSPQHVGLAAMLMGNPNAQGPGMMAATFPHTGPLMAALAQADAKQGENAVNAERNRMAFSPMGALISALGNPTANVPWLLQQIQAMSGGGQPQGQPQQTGPLLPSDVPNAAASAQADPTLGGLGIGLDATPTALQNILMGTQAGAWFPQTPSPQTSPVLRDPRSLAAMANVIRIQAANNPNYVNQFNSYTQPIIRALLTGVTDPREIMAMIENEKAEQNARLAY